jgi:hypothetical protein
MKSSFSIGTNWRATRLSGITPFCLSVALLVIAVPVPSHAQLTLCNSVTPPKYCPAYAQINANIPNGRLGGNFWRQVTKMGGQLVPTGLGVWDNGTFGPGIISEATSYAMILAALYGDKNTFDRLSATVQAGIAYNKSKGNPPLFPWWWTPNAIPTEYSPGNNPPNAGFDSASDADINIALAYIYADIATQPTVYGWKDPALNYFNALNYINASQPNPPPPTYHIMASNYIAAIRGANKSPNEDFGDFSTKDTITANNYVLANGYTQATKLFSDQNSNWHPDYSDIRAYQLFKAYDPEGAVFWDMAISITKASWKAIFYFGSNDTRTKENPNTGQINPNPPSTSWVMLSNPTYLTLQANSDYSKVKADRDGGDAQLYTADSQRLPIRLLNYLNATKNSGDTDMSGIASANYTALATSYTNTKCQALTDKVNIGNPWASINPVFIQNFNAAGLFAYASNTLSYVGPPFPPKPGSPPLCPGMTPIHTDLAIKFGDGTNGTIPMGLDDPTGFNPLLSLWALTVSIDGQTPLQKCILSQPNPKCSF